SVRIDALERACQELLRRHVALRASFHCQDVEKPVQIIQSDIHFRLTHADWSTAPDADARLNAYLADDRVRGFELSEAPLMRVHLVRVAPHRSLLVWSCHHILLDGWSFSLL